MSTGAALPTSAQVVIVGGGIVGLSVAYHLTKHGWHDVVLLERQKLTSGTTWHAAGLVGQLRATHNLTRLAKYTAELFSLLELETGVATGFKQRGSLAIAATEGRWEELRRGASMARHFGLDAHLLTPSEARDRWPLLNVDDVVGGLFIPKDGMMQVVLPHQILPVKAEDLHAAVTARWTAFHNAGRAQNSVPTVAARESGDDRT